MPEQAQEARGMKPQSVRLADVLLIGPLMIWGGFQLTDEYPVLGPLLGALGIATVFYNGYNFMQVRELVVVEVV